ncbi:MAG: single-stranded-DNA-specific exonuclease RecJ [Pseudomonadota bacterium]
MEDILDGGAFQYGRTASGRRWLAAPFDKATADAIVAAQKTNPILANILAARGIGPKTVGAFLNPSLREDMPDPFVLAGLDEAVESLGDVILSGGRIGIFGDYDVDGVTAASMLARYFDAINADRIVYLPDRILEGYGPTAAAFGRLLSDGADIIVTVDCGAAAHGPVNDAASKGAVIVVLDHHLMADDGPTAAKAIVNPNRPDDQSGLKNLSAAGVVFMALVALNRSLREKGFFDDRPEPDLRQWLDLTALGLVCDVMEMTGFTRTLVAQGLKVLDQKTNIGLTALAKRAGAKGAASTYHLGFLLGPRINAAGRIGHAQLAFDLLTSSDETHAAQLAERLHIMNADRQAIEADTLTQAMFEIEQQNRQDDDVIVIALEKAHPGVVGIVAGRLKETYDRPVLVLSSEKGLAKGSGRSIQGVDLGSVIAALSADGTLVSGGGHAMAAGLTVVADRVDALRTKINGILGHAVAKARRERSYLYQNIVAPTAVSKSMADLLAQASPFGPGAPEPMVVLRDLHVEQRRVVGENHLSILFKDALGEAVRAIAFRAVGEPLDKFLTSGAVVHVLGKVRADDWRGGDHGQLHIVDVAVTG